MSHTSIAVGADSLATTDPVSWCRYLVPVNGQCPSEAVDQHAGILLCAEHLTAAQQVLIDAGAVVPVDQVTELVAEGIRAGIAQQIVAAKVADGTLVRTASGGLVEVGGQR